ncbi:phosphoadenosine phosphosulfate reductase family protein [uncultured Dubosiella sp.]|uniref:phosphoadenosine phosphosulfate reductase domain-containing protein n=1 Tax=uncultured Dubosiella sp. TaxID=1937011 RepID=UPI00272FD033|nr:phosphoadenosine phosphosulfate reductase family protein [uncultured Dubosiella sp.]
MDARIEKITRESERLIRKQKMSELLSEDHDKKVKRSGVLVDEFVENLGLDTVYVSTSGGKDSACVSRLCKENYPEIKHIMFDTGLEYQATKDLAKKQGAIIIPPKTGWKVFCEEKGYPVGSKQVSKRIHDAYVSPLGAVLTMFSKVYHLSDKWLHFLDPELVDFPISQKCCDEFKKRPAKKVKLNPIMGTRIQESNQRKNAWKKSGCNSYSLDYKHGISRPISLWTDVNVDRYIDEKGIELSEIYTQYEQKRTGCVNCPYGAQMDGSRFDLLKKLEPTRYNYFINRTHLGYILALSGVEIVSDDTYMAKMKKAQERVKKWHIEAKGNDKYFTFKVKWLTDNYADEDIMRALNHIRKNLMYDYEQIKKKIEEAPSKLKKVKCLENDEVYEDVESAAKALDLTTSLVADQLCGIRKSVKKGSKTYHFRRINEQRRIKK